MASLTKKYNINKTIKKSDIDNDIIKIITKLNNNSDYYLNLDNIKKDLFEKIEETLNINSNTIKNKCMECNSDIGENNPRQLCGKIKCNTFSVCNLCNNIKTSNNDLCQNFECLKERHYC